MASEREALASIRGNRAALEQALRDAGATIRGAAVKCPFHEDAHASGSIHETDGVWQFTCQTGCAWTPDGGRTGDVLDVIRKARGLDFAGAAQALGVPRNGARRGRNGRATRRNGAPGRDATAERANGRETRHAGNGQADPVDVQRLATEAAARLQGNQAALDKLLRTRAIDCDTARRFGVGVTADGRYWTWPIRGDNGELVAVKHHRARPETERKAFWTPSGVSSVHAWPVGLDSDGPVWLCPGEAKALAVIAAGRPAVGITGGEGADLPADLPRLLMGRAVALAADDDDAGRKWAVKARDTLTAAGIDARIVNYGANAAAELKDIGDVVRQWAVDDAREPAEVAASLDAAYERADPWSRFKLGNILRAPETWKPVEHVASGFAALDKALDGGLRTRAVTLLAGKPGRGKTQTAIQAALNAARAGDAVGVVTLEMTRAEVCHLIVAQLANVPRKLVASGNLWGAPCEQVRAALAEAERLPLTIIDDEHWNGAPTRSRISAALSEGARRFGWRLVVLDYLGLLAPEETDRGDYMTDCENSAMLKRLASAHGLALLVVADMRKGTKREDAANLFLSVTLDDVRGAGRATYDAANVFFLDSEQAGNGPVKDPAGIVRLRALKTRFAAAGSRRDVFGLRWHPRTGRIVDLPDGETEAGE